MFKQARDVLLDAHCDYDAAIAKFVWPQFEATFNWAIDWFDEIARGNPRTALWIVEENGAEARYSFNEIAIRSDIVAHWLKQNGVGEGDSVMLMLGNQVELWESMLAVMKLGAVIVPTTTAVDTDDITDRVTRGNVKAVIANTADVTKFDSIAGDFLRVAIGGPVDRWLVYPTVTGSAPTSHDVVTAPSDRLLLYFTSGTTSRSKLVEHTQTSYPVGHLTTMNFLGLRPGDIHLNISCPGWVKHAWSCFFAPWIAEATVFVYNYSRFDAEALLAQLRRAQVSTFCAPRALWRMLIQSDLGGKPVALREVIGAGEPLNPEVIGQIRRQWGLTIRDGFGQTETTALVGTPPGLPLEIESMGKALPGVPIVIVDPVTGELSDDGEICLDLAQNPVNLMTGYLDDPERNAAVTAGGFYHTGDIVSRHNDGYITYVGRTDDVYLPTTRCHRSSWKACSSNIPQWRRLRSFQRRTRLVSRCPRPTSRWPLGGNPTQTKPSRLSSTPASICPRTCVSGASSSSTSRKRSREKSAASNYAVGKTQPQVAVSRSRASGVTANSPSVGGGNQVFHSADPVGIDPTERGRMTTLVRTDPVSSSQRPALAELLSVPASWPGTDSPSTSENKYLSSVGATGRRDQP